MDVTQLPFNRLIGLQGTDNGGVSLPAGQQYTNHLGTVHGSALMAVAEAGSGAFIVQHFSHFIGFIPVVRNFSAKFRKPAHGTVSSRVTVSAEATTDWIEELANRRRLLAEVPVEVIDSNGEVVLRATVEWFIAEARP